VTEAFWEDLRVKVLRAVDQGYPREEIVKLLGVSLPTIKRYLKQRRETGTVAPKAIPGRTPKKLGPLQAGLVAQLQEHDDLGLEEQCRLWETRSWQRATQSWEKYHLACLVVALGHRRLYDHRGISQCSSF
jgi:transposase